MPLNLQLLIAAGGMGDRLGHASPKALAPLAGRPLLVRTLERFDSRSYLNRALITAPEPYLKVFSSVVDTAFPQANIRIISGGATRQQSVSIGLSELEDETDLVIIHDAARPFPPLEATVLAIEAASEYGASTIAIPCADTILRADEKAMLVETPDRSELWACQTPQVFGVEVIRDAHAKARAENRAGTDDATLVRMNGGTVKLIEGDARNFKITTADDLRYAEYLIHEGLV